MASQTRSKLSISNAPVTALPSTTQKSKKKPVLVTATALAIVSNPRPSVIVKTVSTGDDTKPSASASIGTTPLTTSPGETVPTSREVSVDITGGNATFASASATDTFKSSADNKNNKQLSAFSFTSMRDSRTTTNSAANDDDDKKPSNNDSANDNDKKKNDKSNTDTPPAFSNFVCLFVFDTDPTRPFLAQRLNGGYDLSFDIDDILDFGSLPLDPSFVLQAHLKYLLMGQAEATGDNTNDRYMNSSRQLIIKTITDSFSFS